MKNLIHKIKNWFKPKPHISFRCIEGAYNLGFPIQSARKVLPEWVKTQAKNKDVKLARCPGMFDMTQAGYIMPAWTDLTIKVNKQGIFIKLLRPLPPHLEPQYMDFEIVRGLAPVQDKGLQRVIKICTPWAITTKKGYCAYLLPAFMHSSFLDKLYVYPGIVDYDSGFSTVNVIITGLKECEFTIYAGEPLLQIIPMKREDVNADVGKASEREKDLHVYSAYSRAKNFYRKTFHSRKIFNITTL